MRQLLKKRPLSKQEEENISYVTNCYDSRIAKRMRDAKCNDSSSYSVAMCLLVIVVSSRNVSFQTRIRREKIDVGERMRRERENEVRE